MTEYVHTLDELTTEQQPSAGGKGGSLARMVQAGFPVPEGFVILPDAFEDEELRPEAWEQVQTHLVKMRAEHAGDAFAVRSSALSEDSAQASFAGEFESVLNVRTDEEIRAAIHTVYGSRHTERVKAYSQAKGIDEGHEVAVIVQRLVGAESSGVMFTANPVTGQRDQAMISAAWGLGEAIVQGVVTPDTIVVEKSTGNVITRDTADKQVMTVCVSGGTQEQPVPEAKRRAEVLSDEDATELARLGAQIEDFYGMPMDIEWVQAEGRFIIVQARPITALPAPELPPPTEWKLPAGAYVAMRNNIVELMADPLTPLYATFGLEAINTSMHRTMAELLILEGVMPENTIITVNQYAYYNGSIKPGQIVRILLNSVGIMKHMFTGAVERWTEKGRPNYIATVAHWEAQPWRDASTTGILSAARELTEAAVDAFMALVAGVIPAAWITEALFTGVYKILKRRDDPLAPTYLLGFDSIPIQAEKALYDLADWARTYPGLASYLIDTPAYQLATQLENDRPPSGVDANNWQEWQRRMRVYLQRYGHTIYNLDFGNPVPADDPAPLLETLKLFVGGGGVNPHERQQAACDRREQATQRMMERLTGLRLKFFRNRLSAAQRFAPLREDGLADVGLSYPLLRQMLREVGRRFVENGVIDEPDDIFWLNQDEVTQTAARLDRGEDSPNLSEIVPQRKNSWRAARRVAPPMMLPQIKLFGIDIAEIKSGRARRRAVKTLKGVAASPGIVTASARVVHGPEDFAQMKTGEILVAALTTPAWTPLFARAAAVVTDVGGPLSHGSIVAREYGIPAVLGTGAATVRIHTGQVITVDGSRGVVNLAEN